MAVDATLFALSEPHRREILGILGAGELPAGAIAGHFAVSRPAISQHLAVLKAAGLVSERREGTKRLYSARPQGIAELRAWVDAFWQGGLERLRIEAEKEARIP